MTGTLLVPVSRRRWNPVIPVLLAVLLVPTLLAGCSKSSEQPPQDALTYVANAQVPRVQVSDTPGGPVTHTLSNPASDYGEKLVFLVLDQQGDWVKVQLPIRPNGTAGWVKASDVTLKEDPYRLDVAVKEHELRLFQDGELQQTFPIGVGTSDTPTPGGTYYLKVLIKTTSPKGSYGPYAFGLSGFSNVLKTFNGGDGVIGLHGTNEPETVGTDVSHGCIRLHNEDITKLAFMLPLGTPVKILA
jgi:lipoprotein-anchoring transpeptidase ErfK/SrfK